MTFHHVVLRGLLPRQLLSPLFHTGLSLQVPVPRVGPVRVVQADL